MEVIDFYEYKNSKLHLITEHPEEVIDHGETESTLDGYTDNRTR